MRLGLVLFLASMIFILALFAEIDGRDADSHMKRATDMEKEVGLPEYVRPPRPGGIRGTNLLQIGSVLLVLFNLAVILNVISHL